MPDLDTGFDAPRSTATPAVPLREGLPPGFRMRADAHYVEQLDSGVFRAPSTIDPVPSLTPATADNVCGGFDELTQSLSALLSATSLISTEGALTHTVACELVKAEAGRALRLLTAMRVLRDDIPVRRSRVLARAIIERAVRITATECQLRGVDVVVKLAGGFEAAVHGDEGLLTGAIAGLVGASCALMGTTQGRALVIGASLQDDGRVVAFTVRQSVVAVPESWISYVFEKAWPIGPGGAESLLALQAARRAAVVHDGRLAAVALRDGTNLTLTVPVLTREM